MPDIDQYLDAARAKTGARSDRQLSTLLGLGPTAVTAYRTRRSLPEGDTMVKIAALADMDQRVALTDLGLWHSKGPAKAVYQEIARALAKTAAVFLLAFTISLLNEPLMNTAYAKPLAVQGHHSPDLYIMRIIDDQPQRPARCPL